MRRGQNHCFGKIEGVSAAETMMTLGILGMLITFGVPSFKASMQNQRIDGVVHAIVSHALLGRSEAIKRNVRVILCPSEDGTSCIDDYTQWHRGLLLFADQNKNRAHEPGEAIIRFQNEGLDNTRILTSSGRKTISFYPSGNRSVSSTATFTVCNSDHQDRPPKTVIFSLSGRIRTSETNPSACS